MNRKVQQDIARKLNVLNYAQENGDQSQACRYLDNCWETFHTWKGANTDMIKTGLMTNNPCPSIV